MKFRGAYVDGRFRPPRGGNVLLVEDPGDLDHPVGLFRSDPRVVEAAVAAARQALPGWRGASLADRIAALRRYQERLRAKGEPLSRLISRETGKPWEESRAEVRAMIEKVDVTVEEALPLAANRSTVLPDGTRLSTRFRPLGVMAVIGPFNVPGHLPNGQIVPALLMGNTVVFKPSEKTAFTGQMMAELWDVTGLPPGVFNLVPGDGRVGAALAGHPGVDGIFFTGSAAAGRRVAAAAPSGALVALELGGKNAALVLPDAALEGAVKEIVQGAFSTTGQRCSSTSRVLLHKDAAGPFMEKFLRAVDGLTTGYFEENPFMGPLIDGVAVARFLRAQKTARRLGYDALREGKALKIPRRGRYVCPSVHLRAGAPRFKSPAYWDEELFAPDVAVTVCRDEDEMVAAHNASRYGLAAAVFTADPGRFAYLRERLEAGVIHWNRSTAMTPGRLPFGGLKASGNHRPAGLHAVLQCVTPVGSVERPA